MPRIYFMPIAFSIMLFWSSCSKRVMEAIEVHKMHDEYFILRQNGRYSIKINMMGMLRMPDSEHGRYIRSGDSVYLVKKKGRGLFETYGYGLIDSTAGAFYYYASDTAAIKKYRIHAWAANNKQQN